MKYSRAFNQFYELHYRNIKDGLRFGQRFHNMYVKSEDETTKELFYESDTHNTFMLIQNWLNNNHHFNELPPEIKRDK